MNACNRLHELGQSLWLDQISRGLLTSGKLKGYVDTLSVTGLTSNPTIFERAARDSTDYDHDIHLKEAAGILGEELIFELMLDDVTYAADLFRHVHDKTNRVDGWASIEVSPKLAYESAATIAQVKKLFRLGARPNLFVKIPGTNEGLAAIESSIFHGVPVNVTLLFSSDQYLAAAEAYMRGIERRIEAGLDPHVASVASLFVSRWDRAVAGKVPAALEDQLGIAVAKRTYRVYRELLASNRWQRLINMGARPQRLLWGSTGTKNPKARDVLYVEALAAPHTINTIPEETLHAFADHGRVDTLLAPDGGNSEEVLGEFRKAQFDLDSVAAKLQSDGVIAFAKSWDALLARLTEKGASLLRAS